jgi:tRNA(adenine34) deaminase
MAHALGLARLAAENSEVPVGAVLVAEGKLLGAGYNCPIGACDPTAHAEILALREAAAQRGNYRLVGSTLYVTLEPCPMCAGALVHARVSRIVYGAADPRSGACGSVLNLPQSAYLNHRCEVQAGVLSGECAALLRDFFRARREKATG